MKYLIFLFCVKCVSCHWRVKRELDCFQRTKLCINDFKCMFKMTTDTTVLDTLCGKSLGYSLQYQEVVSEAAKTCPKKCALELNKFIKSKHGSYLMSCDCPNRDSKCLTMKSRIRKCIASGLGWPMNDTKPSCSEAWKNCTKNSICNKAMGTFLLRCSQLISGVECNANCTKALDGFLELSIGKMLENECECDGVEEPICRGIRAHYQELCSPTRITRKSVSQKLNTSEGNSSNLATWNCGSFWAPILGFLTLARLLA